MESWLAAKFLILQFIEITQPPEPALILIRYIVYTAVVPLVEALHFKPEGRVFNSRWCHWNFSLA
jgi:hypothetical protein